MLLLFFSTILSYNASSRVEIQIELDARAYSGATYSTSYTTFRPLAPVLVLHL